MNLSNALNRAVRLIALAAIILAVWPGVVLIETPLDQAVKTALQAMTAPAALVDAAQQSSPEGAYSETSHWIIRAGFPLRPFCGADFIRTIEGRTTGGVRTGTDETTWNSTYGDPVGALWTVLLIVGGWLLRRFTVRRRSDHEASSAV